jgi:hypothetical protein
MSTLSSLSLDVYGSADSTCRDLGQLSVNVESESTELADVDALSLT